MASITIRNLDDQLKARLRVTAAAHGHSMEEEVRILLRRSLSESDQGGLGSRIRDRFAEFGGVELELPSRAETPRTPDLD